jgi:Arc/MetJ-type ribon-helix-helix transcriptional regulator
MGRLLAPGFQLLAYRGGVLARGNLYPRLKSNIEWQRGDSLCHAVNTEAPSMPIQLKPETERLAEQELASGRFQSVDEIIQQGLRTRSDEAESERLRKHRRAIEPTRAFVTDNPIRISDISFQELIDEGRRL